MNPWGEIIKAVISFAQHIPSIINEAILGASQLTTCLIVLGVCVGLIILLYVILTIFGPRMFTISHSADFDPYMAATAGEIASVMHRLARAMSSGVLDSILNQDNAAMESASSCSEVPQVQNSPDTMSTLGSRLKTELQSPVSRPDLAQDMILYFRYHRSLAAMSPYPDVKGEPPPNMLSRMDLKTEASFTDDLSGETDKVKVAAFHAAVYLPVTQMRADATALSIRLNAACALDVSKEASLAIMDIHLLRLHLDVYHDQTCFSYETRKSGPGRMPTAIITLYWWPEVQQTFLRSIPALWRDAKQEFKDGKDTFERAWRKMGDYVHKLPCYMSHMDATWRAEKCDGVPPPKPKDGFKEGFSLGGLINGIMEMLGVIGMIINALLKFFEELATDPFKAIIHFVMIIVGMSFGLIPYLVFMLIDITTIYKLPGIVYAFTVSYVYAFVLTVYEIQFTFQLAIPYLLLTLLDLVTHGAIMHMLRCESLPSDWVDQPYTAFDNVRGRVGLLCACPCLLKGFAPYMGVACLCQPKDTPPFCPQQQVFRAFRSLSLGDPWIFDAFTADAAFFALNPKDQQKQMAAAYHRKAKFLGRCYSAVAPFSFITRHVCSNLDAHLPHATSEEKRRIETLCHQAHCDFEPGAEPSTDDLYLSSEANMLHPLAKASFCAKRPIIVTDRDPDEETAGMGSLIIHIVLGTCMALVLLYALLG